MWVRFKTYLSMLNPFDVPQYLEKFGLKEAPYTTNPDERYLYLTPTHKEAISMCGHVINHRQGAAIIVGDQGTGKTTIMRRLYNLLKNAPDFKVAVIETAEHSPTIFQLTREILESFGVDCIGQDTQTRMEQLKKFLLDSYKDNKSCILLMDEAQQMKGSILESLRGILNFEIPQGGKLLQIVLFAMPGINRKLRFAKSFSNRAVRAELRKMTRMEMEEMLRWRFAQAGGTVFPFTEESMNKLFEKSEGNPRSICSIAQLALEVSAIRNCPINLEMIEAVASRRISN